MPVAPAAIEMKVMDPVVSCEYKSDMTNLMPQLSKQSTALCDPLAWQGTYVGRGCRLFSLSQLLREEAAVVVYIASCCSLFDCINT